jgi:hypothetical protein
MQVLFRPPIGGFKRLAKMTETFLAEVGVLLFVFPVLDEYVQHGHAGITTHLIAGSLAASVCCYAVAGFLAVYIKE